MRIVRHLVAFLVVPLCLLAGVLAASPWLHSFPGTVAGVPLFGAAVISVLLPVGTSRGRPGRLWTSLLLDLVGLVIWSLGVVLQDPSNLAGLVDGLTTGPSQILTYALPLVSPRSLMVAPVALVWVAGTLAGQCAARGWTNLLPHTGFLVSFGLAYAATRRAAGADGTAQRIDETLLAAALLATLLALRGAQAWVRQERTAEATQPDGVLPLRGLAVAGAAAVVVATVASLIVQSSAFPKQADRPQRVPPVATLDPLTPLGFVAGLRPQGAGEPARPVFSVTTDAPTPGYFPIANVDFYDGSGWSFDRTFRPSGGVLPRDADTTLRAGGHVDQQYRISAGALSGAPWMPFAYRPEKVVGASVAIDPDSGMVVPAAGLAAASTYSVASQIPTTYDKVRVGQSTPDTATAALNTQLPLDVRTEMGGVVRAFEDETGVPSVPTLPFLRAVQRDLLSNYTLSSAARGSAGAAQTGSGPTGAGPTGTSPTGTGPIGTSPTGSGPSGAGSTSTRVTSTPTTRPPARRTGRSSAVRGGRSAHRTRALHVRPLAAAPAGGTAARSASPTRTAPATTATRSTTDVVRSPQSGSDLAGSTVFADVLGSILGPNRNGTPEQFATLVALVARSLSVPARVATGFRVIGSGPVGLLASGRHDVTTADAWSWVELPVVGAGWVVLDATPTRTSLGVQQSQTAAPAPPSSSVPPSQRALVTQSSAGNAPAPRSDVPEAATTTDRQVIVVIVAALVGLILLLSGLILARKPRRAARRRRSPDPRVRLIGAWQETLDLLTEAGLPELSTMTSTEVADLTTEQFGEASGTETRALGTAATVVAYSRTTEVTPADADRAWATHRTVRRAVRTQLDVRNRVASGLRYHRPQLATGPVSPLSWADREAAEARSTGGVRAGQGRRYRGRRRAH